MHKWIADIGLDSTVYGTHSMRRTKATLIYKRTKNLRAVQLLLDGLRAAAFGHDAGCVQPAITGRLLTNQLDCEDGFRRWVV